MPRCPSAIDSRYTGSILPHFATGCLKVIAATGARFLRLHPSVVLSPQSKPAPGSMAGCRQFMWRVGRDGEGSGADIYLDLGDSAGRAVKINAREWEVVARPPIHFRRPGGLLPLQEPSHDGWIELLRSYVNVSEPEFRLLIGWMAAALLPEGPYPILAIHGEQGSAKSTLARVVRGLIDPQASPLLAEPHSTRDLIVTARSGWLLAYDNISELPDWLSDSLCRLATGGGFAGRRLYSDDERNVIEAHAGDFEWNRRIRAPR